MNIRARLHGTGKRLTAFITVMSMTMALLPAFNLHVFAEGEFSGGSGTEASPYIIKTAEDFRTLAGKVNAGEDSYATAYYKIPTETYSYTYKKDGKEITAEGVKAIDISLLGSVWTPIGTEEHPFKGHFDGGNGTNKGNGKFGSVRMQLEIGEEIVTAPNRRIHTAGLFGYIDGATIENVYTSNNVVGNINLNTYNTYSGETKSYHCIGAVVGFAKDSTVKFCTTYSPLNITAVMGNDGRKTPELYVGGVVGGETGSEIFRCINNSVVQVWYNEDGFDGNNVAGGKKLPDTFLGGVVGGVNGISSGESKIHGAENLSEIVINVPHVKNADNIKLFAGGILGGISDVEKDKLELCQDYNRSSNARVRVTNSQGDPLHASNAVACAGGIFGYDDAEKKVHVHDCKNDAAILNVPSLSDDSANTVLYTAGIVAGRGNVDNCLNINTVKSTGYKAGICYSVPHHCYSTGEVEEGGKPVCIEEPEDKNYYNYFSHSSGASSDSNWQHYVSDTSVINSGELTWLLQGDQDSNYLHWTSSGGTPSLGGGYYVKSGGRPLDYWLNKGWGAYNNDMNREIIGFAPAWSYRIAKYRFVTTGEGNDGIDPETGKDLKETTDFGSFEKSTTDQFYHISYGYYCGRIGGDLPKVPETDSKIFVQWQTTPIAEGASIKPDANAFAYSGSNTTVYAVSRVKFGANDEEIGGSSDYRKGNTIPLGGKIEYGAEPAETYNKFTYSLSAATADDEDIENAEQYFTVSGENLTVAQNTPVGVYTVTVTATEKAQNITLLSASMGTDPVDFTVTVTVEKIDPEYTAPTEKTSKYTGEAQEVITKGSTDDGTMVYTLTPEDNSSWSENVPKATAVGPYTVYWKVLGDSNHKDTDVKSVSGVIIPDSADPAHAIIITPADSWVYDGNTYALATVTQNPADIGIEWSTDNSTWSDNIPTAKDAGTYPVYWRTKSNAHGVDLKSNFEVEVKKANPAITPPTGLKKKYNGSAQELIEEGSTDKGTMKYSLNPSINDWSDDNWSTDIPTGTAAGDYKVYYRVFLDDTKNYTDSFDKANPTFVNAKITKLTNDDINIKVVPTPDWTYDGNTYSLVQSISQQALDDNGLRLMYSTDGGTKYDYTVPQGTDAGSYNVRWKTVGNANVGEITGEFTVTVSKKKPNIVIEKQADWTYDGKTYQLVTVKENNEKLRFSYSVNNGTPQNTPPSGQSAGTYKVSVTSSEDTNYETYQGSFEIVCSPVKATGTVTAKSLTYNYNPQELVEPESVTNGKMMYRVGSEGAYSDTIPMRSDAGTYTVWYFVKGTDANYEDTAEQSVDVTIAQFDPNPTVNKSEALVYNAAKQTLLTVDTAEHHGTVMYKVQGDPDWSTSVPKRTNAGTYTVEWKVTDDTQRDDGETNLVEYNRSETVTIGKYKAEVAYIHAEDKTYDGTEQQLVEPIKALNDMGTVKYAVTTGGSEPSDWTEKVPAETNAATYTVWFRIDGDENIEGVDKDSIYVTIKKIVPDIKVTVNSALRYNGKDQDLIASATDIATISPAGGTLEFAVTTEATAKADDLKWSTAHPTGNESVTYYVWYQFIGDDNTESIKKEKGYTSVISGTAPTVAIRGEVLTYTGSAQELIEGTVNGDDIKNNTDIQYYVTNDESESFTDPADAVSWATTFPQGTDAKKYYVWYYIPANASEGTTAFGPTMVESEIKKAPAPDYDYSQEDASKLAPDGLSFTKPWGTKVGEITLKYDEVNGGYKWHDQVKDLVLNMVGGPFNYPADFTDKTGNYEDGIVQIKITVTPLEEDPPNIKIDYINEKLTGFDPSRTYELWDTTHTDSTTLTITDGTGETDNHMDGENTEIVLKATDHTTGSTKNLTIPTRPAAPDMSVFEVHQPAFVTAQGRIGGITSAMEYSVGDSGAWITGTGRELTVPQNTKVFVRYKAVAEDLPAQTGSFRSLPQEISITESQRAQVTMNNAEVGIDYINHKLIPEPGEKLEPNTKYTITVLDEDKNEGKKYRAETDENGKFPIEEDWHGKTVKIVKSGDILYTVDSEPKYKFVPLRPDPPEPESKDSKITNVKNNAAETDEYRLLSGTAYTEVENPTETNAVAPDKYVVRVQATENTFASLDSEVVIVKEKTPAAEIDYEKETLKNLDYNSEYIITELDDDKQVVSVITVITDANGEIPIKENWFGKRVDNKDIDKILLIQKKGKSEEFNSDPQERPIQPRPAPPEPKSWDSKITEVNSTMEYRLASATSAVYNSYRTVENQNETNVVVPNNYEVRYKAVAGESFASLPEEIEVKPMDKPNGEIDYPEVKIKNLQPNADYTIIDENDNEGIYTADGDGKVPIKEEWMGTDIQIIRNGDDARADSEAQTLPIPERSAFPADKPSTPSGRGGGLSGKTTPSPSPSPTAEPDNGNNEGDNQGGDVPSLNKTDHFAYISGYEDSTFRPDRTITRGEAAVIFARLMTDFDNSRTYTPSFPDLRESDYFYSYVGFLESYGIITGYEDGTFRPWESITRTEFAVIASKFAELTETEENVFTDVEDNFWGKPFILLAHKNGWVNGYEDETFRPHALITRAEVVSIVNRMLERSCDTEFAQNNADNITIFGDVSESHWAYNDIIEAANGHLYVTEDGGEVWTDLT